MLVLAIASTFIMMSLRAYQSYKMDEDYRIADANLSMLFDSLGQYYRANCALNGSLFPTGTPPVPDPTLSFPILPSALAPGFLNAWPLRLNPFVDTTKINQAYVFQFNPLLKDASEVNVNYCTTLGDPSTCTTTPMPANANIQILVWLPQIAMKIKDVKNIQAIGRRLNADCVSDIAPDGKTVLPCPNPKGKTYLVWQRLPSFASPELNSSLSESMTLVKQFNLQYTHDQMYEFNLGNKATTTGTVAPKYYVCGG